MNKNTTNQGKAQVKPKTKKPGYVKNPKKGSEDYDRWNRGGEGVVPYITKKKG